MNIFFMGTPEFANESLKALIQNNYNIIGVATQPDKPVGRSGKLTASPVKITAGKNNLKVYQPLKAREPEFIETLKNIGPDLIVVVAYGHILPLDILNIPKLGCINIHGSLLPKYRGAAPIQWAIINGEKVTGVTSMYMDEGMDTGDIILKKEYIIKEEDCFEDVYKDLAALGAETLIETLDLISKGIAPRIKQNHAEATTCKILKKENGCIDWNKDAVYIKNFIRGTHPWPGAYTFYNNEKFKIFSADVCNDNYTSVPGTIVEVSKDSITVQTGKGIMVVKEIQFENGKRMPVKNYLLGHSIEKGIVLNNPKSMEMNI